MEEDLHGIFGAHVPPVLWTCYDPGQPVSETCRWASWEHNRESGHQLREWCSRRDGFPKPYRGEHDNTAGWCLKHFNTNVIFIHFLSSPVEYSFVFLGKVLGTFVRLCDTILSLQARWGELAWKHLGSEVHLVLNVCKVGFGIYHIKVFKFMKQFLGAQLIPWVTFLQRLAAELPLC